jgi:hypothetical protein
MRDRVDFYQTPEFQSWRNGVYGLYEAALFESYKERRYELFDWISPDLLFLSLRSNIMKAYSSSQPISELISRYDGTELILPGEFDESVQAALASESDVLRSLVYERLAGWHRIAIWCCVAAYHGSYDSVARELRFVVEDALQALRVDQERPRDSLDEKVAWLNTRKNSLRGERLIDETDIPCQLNWGLKQLHKELCDYVHPSAELIRRDLDEKGRMYNVYVSEWYERIKQFQRRTFDSVLTIVARRFPKAAVLFLVEQGTRDMLTEHGFNETLGACEVILEEMKT